MYLPIKSKKLQDPSNFQEKPGTPVSKSATPTSSGSVTPGPSNALKPVSKPPLGMHINL